MVGTARCAVSDRVQRSEGIVQIRFLSLAHQMGEGGRRPGEGMILTGMREVVNYWKSECSRGNGSRRLVTAKQRDDGNLMQADGNSFPEFILGWMIGATEFNHG
jgi:hypothetical protein